MTTNKLQNNRKCKQENTNYHTFTHCFSVQYIMVILNMQFKVSVYRQLFFFKKWKIGIWYDSYL